MAAVTGAVIGLTTSAIGTGMSFAQAAQQQKNIRAAQASAAQAMDAARKKLEVNYYDQLGINKEPYELQREALLSSGSQAIQAAVEGDRGAAAAAGRVQMAQNEAQAGVRTEMNKELSALAQQSAMEDSRLRDIGIQLNLQETQGAQQAMADAEQARTAAITQGVQGLGAMAQQASAFFPLYMQSSSSKALGKNQQAYNDMISKNTLPKDFYDASGKPLSYQAAAAKALNNPNLGTMTTDSFEDYLIGKGNKYIRGINFMDYQAPQVNQNAVTATTSQSQNINNQNVPTIDWNQQNKASNYGKDGYGAYNPYDLFPTLENVNRSASMWNQFNNTNSPSLQNLQYNWNGVYNRQNSPLDWKTLND